METGRSERLGQLMRHAQAGDGQAYLRLLTEISPLLRRFVHRMRPFLQPADIEDIVQDILISVHGVRASYDATRPFTPWLYAIAHNRVVDATRRWKRVSGNEVSGVPIPETFSQQPTNVDGDTYGDPEALREAVRHLPAGQRQAVELVKLRELSLKEASSATGMSVTALKVAVHRGVKALRKALGDKD